MRAKEISLTENDFPMIGKAYALYNISFIAINEKMEVEHINESAQEKLGIKNSILKKNVAFFKIWETTKLLPILDDQGKLLSDGITTKGDNSFKWEKTTVSIKNKKYILLIDSNSNTFKNLAESIKQEIGYLPEDKSSTKEYIEEINHYYTSIINKIPCYVYWKNLNSEYIGCNEMAAKYYSFKSTTEIVGKNDFDLSPNRELAESYRAQDKEIFTSRKPILNIQCDLVNHRGDFENTLVSKVPLTDLSGKVVGLVGITIDVTELTKAKAAAEAANHAKTEFIANMSHDIRTPLTGVIGISEILENNLDNPDQKQYAQWIHESGQQLLGLLNGILDIVSTENINENDVRRDVFDLHQCLHDILQLELPSTKLKGINLQVNIGENVPRYIVNDRTKIHRILLNLIGNAIKFTHEGGVSIDVTCLNKNKKEALIEFSVTDTGIGIPDKLQDKVFDRFFRATPSYKGTYAGHGVGLHIAQSYVKLLGGEIKLESKEDVGTTFYFDIPCPISNQAPKTVASPSPQPSVLASKVRAKRKPSKPQMAVENLEAPTLLLVEDNEIALHIIESLATKIGCNYLSAANGETALALAQSNEIDLIVTDIGLPGISGCEFTKRLRSWEELHHKNPIPIVGLTAHARSKEKSEALRSGMNIVYTKPVNLKTLHTMVNEHILQKKIKKTDENNAPQKLGKDLPDSEKQLFELDQHALFDIQKALSFMGNNKVTLLDILMAVVQKEIPQEKLEMEAAYAKNDWDTIEKLAHKMKGGAAYYGAVRLECACQYLERYLKAGHSKLLHQLFKQMITIIEETNLAIETWIHSQK